MKLKIYFQTVSNESAAHGEYSEQGEHDEIEVESVEEAAQYLIDNGFSEPSSSMFHRGVWYSTTDPDSDYATGDETYYSAHLKGFSMKQEQETYLQFTKGR